MSTRTYLDRVKNELYLLIPNDSTVTYGMLLERDTFKNEKVLPITQQVIGAIFEVIWIWRSYTGVQEEIQAVVRPV